MSRFGTSAVIIWNSGDTFTGGTTIDLEEQDMPQYPFGEERETDEVQYRSLTGKKYHYYNYNKVVYTFNWSNLRESKADELKAMADGVPIFSWDSGGTCLGTFRLVPGSYKQTEVLFELYDVTLSAEEV